MKTASEFSHLPREQKVLSMTYGHSWQDLPILLSLRGCFAPTALVRSVPEAREYQDYKGVCATPTAAPVPVDHLSLGVEGGMNDEGKQMAQTERRGAWGYSRLGDCCRVTECDNAEECG